MYQKIEAWKLCLTTLLITVTFSCFGCDGAIHVKGKVYAQSGHAGDSFAYVDEQANLGADLRPVKGAKVTEYHGVDYSRQPIDKSTLWQDSGETDSGGGFDLGSTTSPFKFHAALVVEKEGYKPVTKVFLHDKFNHDAVVILVPEEKSAGEVELQAPPNKSLNRTRNKQASHPLR